MVEERLKAFAGSHVHGRALVILWIAELEQLLAAKHGRQFEAMEIINTWVELMRREVVESESRNPPGRDTHVD
jgi:hypothetical protein